MLNKTLQKEIEETKNNILCYITSTLYLDTKSTFAPRGTSGLKYELKLEDSTQIDLCFHLEESQILSCELTLENSKKGVPKILSPDLNPQGLSTSVPAFIKGGIEFKEQVNGESSLKDIVINLENYIEELKSRVESLPTGLHYQNIYNRIERLPDQTNYKLIVDSLRAVEKRINSNPKKDIPKIEKKLEEIRAFLGELADTKQVITDRFDLMDAAISNINIPSNSSEIQKYSSNVLTKLNKIKLSLDSNKFEWRKAAVTALAIFIGAFPLSYLAASIATVNNKQQKVRQESLPSSQKTQILETGKIPSSNN